MCFQDFTVIERAVLTWLNITHYARVREFSWARIELLNCRMYGCSTLGGNTKLF